MSSPEYQSQDIHLEDEYPSDDNYDDYTQEEGPEEETNNTDPRLSIRLNKNFAHPSSSPTMTQIQLRPQLSSVTQAKQALEPG